jgi:hypothetical protein
MNEMQNMDEPHRNLLNILVFDKGEIDKGLNIHI